MKSRGFGPPLDFFILFMPRSGPFVSMLSHFQKHALFDLLSHRGHAGSKRHKSNHRWLLCMAVKAVKARHTTFCNGRQCGHARLPSHRKWEGGGGDTLPSYRLAFLDHLEMPICLQFNHSPLMSGTCADGFQNGLVNIIQKLAHRPDRDGSGTAASVGCKGN